jgi:hypothetical protein
MPDSIDDDGIVTAVESRGKICRHKHEPDCRNCTPADSDDPREVDEMKANDVPFRQVGTVVKDLDAIRLERIRMANESIVLPQTGSCRRSMCSFSTRPARMIEEGILILRCDCVA